MLRNRSCVTREFFIPANAIKVSDKFSDAVVYVYITASKKHAALYFSGKRQKPDAHQYYSSEQARAKAIEGFFKVNQAVFQDRAERRAQGPTLVVGDIVSTCWGYEQTNREFFEVIQVKGKSVIVREIAQVRSYDTSMSGVCVPQSGAFIGEPLLRRCKGDYLRIDDVRSASKWNKRTVAGVPVGDAASFSEYA